MLGIIICFCLFTVFMSILIIIAIKEVKRSKKK